jgi:hypothetical protein
MLPILVNHDPNLLIGSCELQGSLLKLSFLPKARITPDMLLQAFNSFVLTETFVEDGVTYVAKADVFAFSVPLADEDARNDIYWKWWINERKGDGGLR